MISRLSSTLRAHALFTLILIGYLALAFGFSASNPIYESTDELHHFRYIRYLQEFGQLPEQRFDQPRIQAHHPPLYYVLAALATAWIRPDHEALYEPVHNPYYGYRYWEINNDNKNQYLHGPTEQWPYQGVVLMVHVARWINIVIGALMVWVTYRIGLSIFAAYDRSPDAASPVTQQGGVWRAGIVATGAAAIVAFNPQFLFMSSAVNNDVLAGLFGSILLWQGVVIIRLGLTTRRSIFIGLAFSAALMAKFNLIFALPLIELALVISVWPKRDWRGFLKANAIILIFVGVIAGWWFVRNYQLYGEPTGIQRMNELWGGRDPRESFWLAVSEIPYAWSSLWGRFGYGQIPLPDGIYLGALIVCLIGLAGLVNALMRREFDRTQVKQLALVIFSALLFAGALFGYMLSSTAGPMGRFYFPGLSAFGLLLSIGLTQWLNMARGVRYSLLITRYTIPVAAFALALVAFFGYFVPAYAAPQRVGIAALQIDQPLNVNFDGKAELLGTEIDPTAAQPGDPIRVTLYWRALQPMDQPYTEFVHLVDDEGITVAQRDTWPGRGMYPTVLWQPGEVFADTLYVNVPDGAYAPNDAMLTVGLYNTAGERLNVNSGSGVTFAENAVPVGQVAIRARQGDYPNATHVNFGDKVELLGYDMSPRTRSILPGEAITVTLYWLSRAPFEADYSVFLNAVRPNQRISTQDSSRPVHDTLSTRDWLPGQVITDVRVLRFPPHANPGLLDVEVGWFLPKAGRLDVLAEDGHVTDSKQLLSKIRIREQ